MERHRGVAGLARHALVGAAASTGGLTLLQTVLARRVRSPSSLAVALGGFVGTFRLLEALGRSHAPGVTASHAAAVGGAVALYLLDGDRRAVVLSFATVEAAVELARELAPQLADLPGIELTLGSLAVGPLIHWWIYRPDLIDRSQLATLDQMCALSAPVLKRMRDEIPSGVLESRCDVFHRGESCSAFHTRFFSSSMRSAFKMYVPIYLFSVIAPKYKRWLHGPRPPIPPLVLQYLRTCACLTLLYQVPLGFSCVSPIKHHRTTVAVAGALTTIAIAAEHRSRRASVMKAIGAYTTCAAGGRLREVLGMSASTSTAVQFILFSYSMSVMFRSPPDLTKSRIMRWLYGYSGTEQKKQDKQNDNKEASTSAAAEIATDPISGDAQ